MSQAHQIQLVFNETLRRPAGRGAPPRAGLVDIPADDAFDRLLAQARQLLSATDARLLFEREHKIVFRPPLPAAGCNPTDMWGFDGQTPRRHSFCHRIAAAGQLVAIGDARQHAMIVQQGAVLDSGVIALASAPLVTLEGFVIGALAVMDCRPRRWSALDMKLLRDLSSSVMIDIEARRSSEQQYRMRRPQRIDVALRCA
jgi:GAF domain-containing protein